MGSGVALRVAVVVVVVLDLGSGVSGRIQARWSSTIIIIMKDVSIFLMDRTDIMRTGYGSVRRDGPSLQSYQSLHGIPRISNFNHILFIFCI